MTTINDLRGFCYPLTPGGVLSLVGDLPWHYATEYLTIAYRTDPAAITAYLPEPLAPGLEPDLRRDSGSGPVCTNALRLGCGAIRLQYFHASEGAA